MYNLYYEKCKEKIPNNENSRGQSTSNGIQKWIGWEVAVRRWERRENRFWELGGSHDGGQRVGETPTPLRFQGFLPGSKRSKLRACINNKVQ